MHAETVLTAGTSAISDPIAEQRKQSGAALNRMEMIQQGETPSAETNNNNNNW